MESSRRGAHTSVLRRMQQGSFLHFDQDADAFYLYSRGQRRSVQRHCVAYMLKAKLIAFDEESGEYLVTDKGLSEA